MRANPPVILFENDGRHPLIYMYEPPIQVEEYQSAVDELAGTPVDVLVFCLGDGRTMLHDTQVGELWGHNVEQWPHLIFRRAHQNAAPCHPCWWGVHSRRSPDRSAVASVG